ncbi:uncharacterized protein DFL_003076 [Arthrobotrys flagrans]|uniref:Uncharacterized protein n=1 Tax=Arthrobotrys flagrans TaxID=97331 RepID=A0A437ACC3_ARTFL|nr:hypothetical protein DFL_003076 [Arthrobotrys flagrans]
MEETTKTKFFIPPATIRVRLVGVLSRAALFSNPRYDGVLKQVPMAELYDDQWFYVIPGTGDKASFYRLKSAYTNEAVYLNRGKAGTFDFNSSFDDQFFSFEAGTGSRVGTFRLVCPATNAVLFSRANSSDPPVGSIPAGAFFDDQWFSFAYEDMELQSIKYDIDEHKILEVQPVSIATKTARNETEDTQISTVTFSESIEEERTFNSELGTKLGVSVEASVGIPLVAESKVTVSTEISTTIAWGTATRTTKSWSDAIQITTGPFKVYKIYASARRSRFTVPFTAIWKSKSTGQTMQTAGSYGGVSVYDFETTYSEVTNP